MQLPKDLIVDGWKKCLANEAARPVSVEAIGLLKELFGLRNAPRSTLAAEYAKRAEDAEVVRGSVVALANELVDALT
jgi:hypothetical protein